MAKGDVAFLSYSPGGNMRCIVGPVVHLGPQFWEMGGGRGSAMVPFKRAMVVSYWLSIVTIELFLTSQSQFVIECLRRSGVRRFGKNFGRKGLADVNQILTRSGCHMQKKSCQHDIFCRLSTMHERDRQANRRLKRKHGS